MSWGEIVCIVIVVVAAIVLCLFAPDGGSDGMGGCEHP